MKERRSGDGDLFAVEVERRGDAVRVALSGELDLGTIEAARREIDAVLTAPATRRLIVDLRELAYMDSTGIRLLLALDAAARSDGYDLAVVKGPRAVQRVLELTHLDGRLPLVDEPGESW